MQNIFPCVRITTLLAMLMLALAGCGSDSSSGSIGLGDGNDDGNGGGEQPTTVAGNAQKGPFQPGGGASAVALAADGSLTGTPANGVIDDNGVFVLPRIDWTGPTRLTMSGSFFDEFSGNFTMGDAQARLNGLADLPGETQANVNLFTHFITARVIKLMADDMAFADARDQARTELGAIMGNDTAPSALDLLRAGDSPAQESDDTPLAGDSVDQNDVGAESGDNTANGDTVGTGDGDSEQDSANLLLFSAASLAADVGQTGIDAIAGDFADDGQINGAGLPAFNAIRQATQDDPDLLATARTNLQNQYGVTPPDNPGDTPPAWAPEAPAAPQAAFTTSGPLEEGATQSFDASESTGTNLTYSWDFDDGETAAGEQTTHVYAQAGTYTVTLTVVDDNDRSDEVSRELDITAVTVTPDPPTASFGFTGNPVINQDLSFDAGDSMGAGLNYTWDFGDSSLATGVEVTHAYSEPGDYTVELTVTDSAGQTDTATQTVTIAASAFTLESKVTADDGESDDRFGSAIAIDGNTAVVGAPDATVRGSNSCGAAYIYTRSGDTWQQQAKLTANSCSLVTYFGTAVAIDNGTVMVGADRSGGTGAVYVFTGADENWAQTQRITANDIDSISTALFGLDLALSGSTLVVGARQAPTDNDVIGAAYVFTRDRGNWTQQAKLTAGSMDEGQDFGSSVAISGETIVVGARKIKVDGESNRGAAYVFTRTGTLWGQQARLTADDGASFDFFGRSVSVDGDTALVTSNADIDGKFGQGAAYVFTRTGSEWTRQAQLTAADGAQGDFLGISSTLKGDTAMVGTQSADIGDNSSQGAVYTFTRANDGSWSQQSKLTASDGGTVESFGFSIAVSGNTTAIGANRTTVDDQFGQGAAFIYRRDP